MTSSKYRRTTEATFNVKVEGNVKSLIQTPYDPKVEISIDLSGIYGSSENYPTPGVGSFMDLLHDGVYSRQLRVKPGSKIQERKSVGHLYLFCKWNYPRVTSVPKRWGADLLLEAQDFNEIFKDATMPRIEKSSRIFKFVNKLTTRNNYGNVEMINFIGYN